MAGEDFKLSVGFDTRGLESIKKDFENMLSGVSGGGSGNSQNQKQQNNIAGGFSKALKATGIVGALLGLEVATGAVSIALGLIGVGIVKMVGFLGLLVAFFIEYVVAFFKDPLRFLLRFGVFLANMILSGIEFLVNTIRGVFGFDAIELPRFQETLVLETYDKFREDIRKATEDGKLTFEESSSAFKDFAIGMKNSFITNTEFAILMDKRAKEQQIDFADSYDENSLLARTIASGSASSETLWVDAFNAVGSAARTLRDEADRIMRQLGRRPSSSRIEISAPDLDPNFNPNRDALEETKRLAQLYDIT